MTHLLNAADDFVDEALAGLTALHSDLICRIDGGVVRADGIAEGQVAVVIGGGSGHYPAFAGLVGTGLATGAVCGNVFTSPSAAQARRVAEEAERGGGVLFLYGNYAGDVLHFGRAQDSLRRAGIDVRTVLVTDDIASAPADERERRRGVAGDLVVFKIAGAAAEQGLGLDEVERVAHRANERTRTLGVAFGGCTLPGADEPLFEIPKGLMSVGLGIHGEPGVADVPIASANGLSDLFVERLLGELPTGVDIGGASVALIVNGLGGVKYEELFVLYGALAERLEAAGVSIVGPECGELVTSLDMAGVSVTLCWLDTELEPLWRAPAHTPAFRRGTPGTRAGSPGRSRARRPVPASEISRPEDDRLVAMAPILLSVMAAVREAVDAHRDELGRIDAVAGDGDHGIGMSRGLHAAVEAASGAVDSGAGAAGALLAASTAWADRAGGTSGALWGAALAAASERLRSGGEAPDLVIEAATAAVGAIGELGGAAPGDKTMMDAAVPFLHTLQAAHAAGSDLAAAWRVAADASRTAAEDTRALVPRLGRARPLQERSIGHPDAGAISFALITQTIADELEARS